MVRVVIQQLAIFLLPLVLYYLYFLAQRSRARQAGQAAPRWEDGPWYWLALGGAALSLAVFVVLALLKDGAPDAPFVPPSGPQ